MNSSPRIQPKHLPRQKHAFQVQPNLCQPVWPEASFRALFDAAPDAMLAVNEQGRIALANAQAGKLFAYGLEEIIGRSIEPLISPKFSDVRLHSANVLKDPGAEQVAGGLDLFAVRSDGAEVSVEISCSPLNNPHGSFVIVTIRDVTHRRRIEELKSAETILRKIAESENRFHLIADTAPVLIWMSGTDNLCTYFNKTWLDFTGQLIDSELGNGWAEGVHSEDLPACMKTYTQSFDRREEFRMEYRLRRHDGLHRWVLDIGVPRFGQNGAFLGYIGVAVDVTEQKQAGEEIRKSENRYRRILETTSEGVWLLDCAFHTSYVNRQMEQMLGYEPGEMLGLSVFEFYFPEDIENKKQSLTRRLHGLSEHIEGRVRRKDGAELWVRMATAPLFRDSGEFDGALAMVSDITVRKRAEESLRLFRTLIDESNDAIEVVDPETLRFLDMNEKACRALGYSRDELLSLKVFDIDPGLDESLYADRRRRLDESGLALFETVHRRKDGSTYPVEINLKRVELDRPYYVNVVRDITERKRLDEAKRQKDLELKEAQRLAQVGSWQWTPATDTVVWSEELYRMAGRDPRLPAPTFKEHSQVYTPESTGRLRRAVRQAMRYGTPYSLDLEMVCLNGSKKWVRARGEVQRDAAGRVIGLRGTAQDVTERKLTEGALSRVNRKVIEAQEQERNRIARELHDDIGQRLTLLALALEEMKQGPLDSVNKFRGAIDQLQEQASDLSTDVQALSHQLHSSKLEHLGIVVAMKSFCRDLSEQKGVEIDFTQKSVPRVVPHDTSLCLFRVLQEGLQNALKHSGANHFKVELRGSSHALHLTIHDSGSGFDPDAATDGPGLGLVSMEERMKLVDGWLSVETGTKRGTTILAWAPLRLQAVG